MDDQRAYVELGAQFFHAGALFGVDLGGAPHARAGGKNLQGVGANLPRPFDGVGCAAGCAEMNADALGHGHILFDEREQDWLRGFAPIPHKTRN
jgi:hypothetical protein